MKDEKVGASTETVAYDKDQLAQLVRLAIGNRSLKEVIEEVGLSRSTISKLRNANAASRPSADTLLKLVGGTPTPLFWKMVEVCGITREEQRQMRQLQQESESFDTKYQQTKSRWSGYAALSAVLRSLENGGYGTAFAIDYQGEGLFAVDVGEQYPIQVFISIIADEHDSQEILSLARRGLSRAYALWELSDCAFFLLTDSQPVFELLQQLPNPTAQMAVALAHEDGMRFQAQHVITPLIGAYAAPEEAFVKLSKLAI